MSAFDDPTRLMRDPIFVPNRRAPNDPFQIYVAYSNDPLFPQIQNLLLNNRATTFDKLCKGEDGGHIVNWAYVQNAINEADYIVLLGKGRHPLAELLTPVSPIKH